MSKGYLHAVFDLDGTLADDSHRQHFVNGEKRNFVAYYALMSRDTVIEPVAAVLRKLFHPEEAVIEIWTGRPEEYRAVTRKWLQRNNIPIHILRMRDDGDNRPADEIKLEWLDLLRTSDEGPPDIVFEDRTKTVEMFRREGIVCLQVQDHDY